MSKEAVPPQQSERTEVPSSPYAQSVEYLLDVLGSVPSGTEQHYFAATWDTRLPGLLTDTATMTAAATGARRKLRGGRFHEAQAVITETSWQTGGQQERFVWIPTSPQEPSARVRVEAKALASAAGYQPLTSPDVVEALMSQAAGQDDYITLAGAMHDRGVLPPESFSKKVSSLLYGLSSNGFQYALNPETTLPNKEKLLQILQASADYGFPLTGHAKGAMVSNLLASMDQTYSRPASHAAAITDMAAEVFGTILRERLCEDIQALDRIFTTGALYRYPFATEQLHERLITEELYRDARTIFGVSRLTFACDYITNVLQQGAVLADSDLLLFLRTNDHRPYRPFGERREFPITRLFRVMDGLLEMVSSRESRSNVDIQLLVTQSRALANVPTEFRVILERLHGNPDDMDPAQAEMDRKCVEIVQAAIDPLLEKELGAHIIALDD